MPRERLGPWIAAGVIAVIAIAGISALIVQAFDDGDSDDGQILSIERDGTKLRLEVDLGAFGLDEDDLEAFEDGDLGLLRALLARIGVAGENLDFESGGLDALRDLFGGNRDSAERDEQLPRQSDRVPQARPPTTLFRVDPDGRLHLVEPDSMPFHDRGFLLGVGLNEDLVVQQVAPGSAALEAGVEAGDAIRTVNGEPVATVEELRQAIAEVEPGATYTLGIARGDAALTLDVTRPVVTAGTIGGERLRELMEALRSGRIELEDVPPQLRPLLPQFDPREAAPQPAPSS